MIFYKSSFFLPEQCKGSRAKRGRIENLAYNEETEWHILKEVFMFAKLTTELGTKLAQKALEGMATALGSIAVTLVAKNAMEAKKKATAKEETEEK